MLQEAAAGGCNDGSGGYKGSGYNVGSGYNIGGYTMIAHRTLHKQLCWEFWVSHNCVCIISEGPLLYFMTCLEILYSQLIFIIL